MSPLTETELSALNTQLAKRGYMKTEMTRLVKKKLKLQEKIADCERQIAQINQIVNGLSQQWQELNNQINLKLKEGGA